MSISRTLMKALLAALIVVLVPSARTHAVVADHLKCYKIKDPQAKVKYTADLGGLIAEPGCTIKVPGQLFCTQATKTNVTPTPPGGADNTGSAGRFLCYKVKCPKATLPTVPWHDQFGTRTLITKTASLVCAPEILPTTTTTTTTTTSSCPPATAFYCGSANCGGGTTTCSTFVPALCPEGMTCTTMGTTCACTGATIPCSDPRLSGLTCNFCQWGTCPPGMTCGGVPKSGACGFDCACH